MITRRTLFGFVPALALAACAQTTGSGTAPTVPPLDKIKSIAAVTVAELPVIVQDLTNTGALKGQQLADANMAVTAAQQILPQIEALQPGVSTDAQITATLTAFLNALQIVMSFIPQTAPYAPAIAALVALVQGYLIGLPPATVVQPNSPAAAALRY